MPGVLDFVTALCFIQAGSFTDNKLKRCWCCSGPSGGSLAFL